MKNLRNIMLFIQILFQAVKIIRNFNDMLFSRKSNYRKERAGKKGFYRYSMPMSYEKLQMS